MDEDPKRVVLVDNNPASFVLCPANGIPVPSFYDDPADRGLEQALQVQPKPTPSLQDGAKTHRPSIVRFFLLLMLPCLALRWLPGPRVDCGRPGRAAVAAKPIRPRGEARPIDAAVRARASRQPHVREKEGHQQGKGAPPPPREVSRG